MRKSGARAARHGRHARPAATSRSRGVAALVLAGCIVAGCGDHKHGTNPGTPPTTTMTATVADTAWFASPGRAFATTVTLESAPVFAIVGVHVASGDSLSSGVLMAFADPPPAGMHPLDAQHPAEFFSVAIHRTPADTDTVVTMWQTDAVHTGTLDITRNIAHFAVSGAFEFAGFDSAGTGSVSVTNGHFDVPIVSAATGPATLRRVLESPVVLRKLRSAVVTRSAATN
jgi:hypothetical protein